MPGNSNAGNNNNVQVTAPETSTDDTQSKTFEAITSQEQLNRVIGERLARERVKYADYEAFKAKALKFDEIEQANKTELEKAQDKIKALEAKASEAELKAVKAAIAAKHSIPAELLYGNNEEEIEAVAERLVAFRKENTNNNSSGLHTSFLGRPASKTTDDTYRQVASALFNPK